LPRNAKFIGPLSRFQGVQINPDNQFEVIGIVSGLEPQRSIFENYLIDRFKAENFKSLIICGQPQNEIVEREVGNTKIISHLPDQALAGILKGTKRIIARSGYSTIMDLKALDCLEKTEFIPTPGQTEQEYLFKIQRSKLK